MSKILDLNESREIDVIANMLRNKFGDKFILAAWDTETDLVHTYTSLGLLDDDPVHCYLVDSLAERRRDKLDE